MERIGEDSGTLTHSVGGEDHTEERHVADFEDALRSALDAFDRHGPAIDRHGLAAVGHRVVHGGDLFAEPVVVDDRLLETVEDLVPLAPLHNPANLEGIRVALQLFPEVPQVAVFDTAFHQTCREHAYTYAVPGPGARSTGSAATASTARRTPSCPAAPPSCSAARSSRPT